MAYESFIEHFGEPAWKETRSITVFNDPRLAGDEFAFLELYCSDTDCDCRRVMFNILSKNQRKVVAVIAYGWESADFYAKWYRQQDMDVIRQMQGPILNPGSPQSELASALLEQARKVLLADPVYVARLKEHYRLFKEKIDRQHFRSTHKSAGKRRRK